MEHFPHMDLLTGVALVTLLFMMLQTEHERCDKVREGWRDVCSAIYATTSAIQLAAQRKDWPEAQSYRDAASASAFKLYSTVKLYGKGSLRKKYEVALMEGIKTKDVNNLMPVFAALDGQLQRKFDRRRLRVL